ncbi:MAG TPA: LLM class flavin-dependent oxidoreductase, partial [Streptomyces sp.]
MTKADPGTPGRAGGDGPHVGLILALTIRGLSVGNYPDMTRVARAAESHGFDSVWLCDHFLTLSPDDYVRDAGIADDVSGAAPAAQGPSSIPLLECWTALSALSRDTTSLRL